MVDVSSAISGVAGIASAFGGGGGSSGGGMVVGGPSPQAAIQAGIMQSNAAKEAASLASQSVKDAIQSINKNYQQARYDVQPYRSEGVQALNQLNQYLGLEAYNPGAAPELVDLASEKAKITRKQINNYINENSQTVGSVDPNNNLASGFLQYTGAGSEDPSLLAKYKNSWDTQTLAARKNKSASQPYPGMITSVASNMPATLAPGQGIASNASSIYGSEIGIQDAVRNELANEALQQNLPEYQRNQAEWQQNMDWYNQYKAEGTFTPQQVVDKISNQPGYQAELNQGQEAISKSAAARGYLGSGRILKELNTFGQNTLSKYYNNTLDRLQGLAGMGANAAGATANMAQQNGAMVGQAKIGLGDTLANSALASGNALAQGYLAANQQYKVIGGSSGGGMK